MGSLLLNSSLRSISEEIGIFKSINSSMRMHEDPKLYGYSVYPCDTTVFERGGYTGNSGGCGYSWENSMLATIGEGVERYCPIFYKEEDIIESSFNDLNSAIAPKEFSLFHDNQYKEEGFPFIRFENDTVIHWTEGYDLTTGKTAYVPASNFYLPFQMDKASISPQISTGLAAHSEAYKAILASIYELVERDAFVINWTQNLKVKKIVISEEIQIFLSQYFPKYFDFHFFDISNDIDIPVVMGILKGKAEFGKFICVAAASRQTYAGAIKKTALELGQMLPYYRYLLKIHEGWNPKDFNEVKDFELHTIYYMKRKDLWPVFDKFINAPQTINVDFSEGEVRTDIQQIKKVLKEFKEKKYNVIFKDLTTPDVRKLGFYVVKIVIPQLVPLSGTYGTYFWGSKRLYDTPKKMGLTSLNFEEINKYPHPFP